MRLSERIENGDFFDGDATNVGAIGAEVRSLEERAERDRDSAEVMKDALDATWSTFGYSETWEYPGQVAAHVRTALGQIKEFDALRKDRDALLAALRRCGEALANVAPDPLRKPNAGLVYCGGCTRGICSCGFEAVCEEALAALADPEVKRAMGVT